MSLPVIDGVELISATTSGGASRQALELAVQCEDTAKPESPKEDDDINYDEEANEGLPQRRPMAPSAKAARKVKKKMQKASRRTNRD